MRVTGLAYSTDYSWIVVCEVLEVFTLSLVWVTAVLYFRHLVPRKYTTTGQALPVIAHFCIGKKSAYFCCTYPIDFIIFGRRY